MNFHSIVNFVAAGLIFCVGFFAYAKNKRSRINFLFFLLTISAFIWQAGTGVALFSNSELYAEWGTRFGFSGIALIPIFSYHLSLHIAGIRKPEYFLRSGYLLSILLFIPLGWTPMMLDGVYEYSWGYFFRAGRFHPTFLVFFAAYMVMAFVRLITAYRKEEDLLERSRKKYFLVALIIAYAGSIDYLPTYGLQVYPLGYLALLCFMVIFSYAIIRYQLMEINIVLTRAGIFTIVYFFVLGIPFVLGYRFKLWQMALWTMFLSATSGPFLYLYFQKKIEERVREKKLKYLQSVDNFLETVKQVRTLEELIELVLEEAITLIGASYAAFYVMDRSSGDYILRNVKAIGQNWTEGVPGIVEGESALVQKLRISKRTIIIGELRFHGSNTDSDFFRTIESCMQQLNASIIVPSIYQDELISFIVLDNNDKTARYDEEDVKAFDSLGINVGLAVKNAFFVEELNVLNSNLIASERLAAIGRLATSAKHEISNPLSVVYNSFQQAMMDIKEKKDNFKGLIDRIENIRTEISAALKELPNEEELSVVLPVLDGLVELLRKRYERPGAVHDDPDLAGLRQDLEDFIGSVENASSEDEAIRNALEETAHYAGTALRLISKIRDFDIQLEEKLSKGFSSAQKISQAVNAIYHLPNELEGDAASVDIEELIDASFDFSGYQSYWENLSDTVVEKDLPEELPDVKGYFNRLVSVFSNLIINAYQAMTEADITLSKDRVLRIKAVKVEEDPGFIDISIANKGPLIREGDLERIFRQGYTTKEDSKGVGLDICKTQVEVFHGGRIFARNIEGFGPEFVVRLPVWSGDKKDE